MWTLEFMAKLKPLAPLALRLAVGFAFFGVHGMAKLRPDGSWDAGFAFASTGAAPTALLYVAAWTEFLAGLGLILGLLTRWACLGLLAVMGYAIFKIHWGDPFPDFELAVVYAAACFALLCAGPGQFSLDRLFFGKRAATE
jgi:putative oxidoreductase